MKPKYKAVYEKLLSRISHMEPGDKLDSETQLSKDFRVSPMTVRRALMLLQQEGRTVGIPGKGTFVTETDKKLHESRLTPTFSSTTAFPEAKLFSASLELADDDMAEEFSLPEGAFIVTINRLLFRDKKTIGIEIAHIIPERFPQILAKDLTENKAILQIIEEQFPTAINSNEHVVRSVLATKREAEMLGVTPPSACMHMVTKAFDSKHSLIARFLSVYLGEEYELRF